MVYCTAKKKESSKVDVHIHCIELRDISAPERTRVERTVGKEEREHVFDSKRENESEEE